MAGRPAAASVLVPSGRRTDTARPPGRADIVPGGRPPGPDRLSVERFGGAIASLAGRPWPGVVRLPLVVPVRTLALRPGKVPEHKEGDDKDQDPRQGSG
jgi:hypothetical protein